MFFVNRFSKTVDNPFAACYNRPGMIGKGERPVKNNPNRERILAALAAGDVVSGEEISSSLGVTRAAVWKQINALREGGYAIPGDPRNGYRLLSDDLLSRGTAGQRTGSPDRRREHLQQPRLL